MPPAVTDAEFRKLVKDRLPRFKEVGVPRLNEKVISVIEPVLSFYGRADVYELKIVDSEIPLIMADSGVVLVISTGLLREVKSDDELLGYVAHEVGHEYFAKYSVYSRYLLTLISEQGNEPDLKRHPNELLTLIELHCDAFAALTLSHLGYDPMAFMDGIERTARDFPGHVESNHPPPAQRRNLVEQLGLKRTNPRQSHQFHQLKHLVEQPSVRSHAINGQ